MTEPKKMENGIDIDMITGRISDDIALLRGVIKKLANDCNEKNAIIEKLMAGIDKKE